MTTTDYTPSALTQAERLALTVARAQLERGDNPTHNITAVLVMTIDRLLDDVEAAAPLTVDPGATCQEDIADPDDGETLIGSCSEPSRFVVERSDRDQSFGWDGKHESCEAHLADVVLGMVGGDDQVRAVVTIRWDGPEGSQS